MTIYQIFKRTPPQTDTRQAQINKLRVMSENIKFLEGGSFIKKNV